MKKFFLALAIVLTLVPFAYARDPDSPFPLDYPVKFPWSSIEGIWQVVSQKVDSTFSFEVQSDCQGRQILKVYQIDPDNSEIIAEGIGTRSDSSNEVYAVMKGRGVQNYFVHIGAYLDKNSSPQRKAVVMRIFSFNSPSAGQAFEIQRVPDSLPIFDESGTGNVPCPNHNSVAKHLMK